MSYLENLGRKYIIQKTNGCCAYCGVELTYPNWTETPYQEIDYASALSIDHIIPTSKGGDDSEENLVACCRSCNSRKSTKTLEELREWIIDVALNPERNTEEWLINFIEKDELAKVGKVMEQINKLRRSIKVQFYFERQ